MTTDADISWFHGKLSREEAALKLKHAGGTEGLYLVRESSSSVGDYVLSLVCEGEVVHYQIRRHGEDAFFSIDDGPIIHGLEVLIEYYKNNSEGLSSKLEEMCVGTPPPVDCRIHGRTNLLHRATKESEIKVVSELLKSGYRNIDAKNADGQTALHLASILGNDDIIKCLLEAGANTGTRDKAGFTPLHYACQENHYVIIRTLVNEGKANIQARSSHGGLVPLHEAASRGFVQCIKTLLALNAPCRPRTDEGDTPYDLAIHNNHMECARLLEEYQAPKAKTNQSDWFHRNIGRQEAFKLLLEDGTDGAFLVRRSTNKPEVFVLTTLYSNHVYNFEIQKKENFFYIDDGPFLESLEHLIAHYSRLSDGLPTKLIKPLAPDDSEKTIVMFIENPVSQKIYGKGTHEDYTHQDYLHKKKSRPSVEYIQKQSLQLLEIIGEGEFGSLFKGIWTDNTNTKIDVAVKVLRNEHIKAVRDSFLHEANIMINLCHPCIVQLLGICLGPPITMVQELVPLGSVLNCLLDHPHSIIPSFHLKLWAKQIASGMLYLEEKRFVHRDLAARNILLVSLEQAKITDFGLSRALGAGTEYYKASQGGRWPIKWYSPESINYGTFSHASDVWSYGVSLWEMYSFGKTPYADMNGAQVIEFIENNNRLNCPDLCPSETYQMMLQCWQYQVEDRPSFKDLYNFFNDDEVLES